MNPLNLRKPNSSEAESTEAAFPKFMKLPKELRWMIWKLAATNPARKLEIANHGFELNNPSPSTLFVNLESRTMSREVLSRLFDGKTFLEGTTHNVYFCPEMDTIVFKDFGNFQFPQDHLIRGPPDKAYRFPPQPECDSVKILELEEDLGMWMYNAVHFGSLDKLILRTIFSDADHTDRFLQEATEYYANKLAHGNCTKIPEIIIQVEEDLKIRSNSGRYSAY
ncbi:hypothetical protein NHQ30_005599 [Ciborinia camelliae]|nr:hypothetical protein NHQ30_005599 [Ciborinia camelliae]